MTGRSQKQYLTPHEVASLLMVTTETIRQWSQKGMLNAEVTAGGHRRFLLQEVKRFARARGVSMPSLDTPELRVLIVDDDEQVASYLLELFQTLGDDVVADVAHDGFNAGHKVFSFRPDVVLLDLMMPGMDGFEVCKQLKSDPATSDIRVIAMTGYPTPENINKIVSMGAETCFGKPFSNQELLKVVGVSNEQGS